MLKNFNIKIIVSYMHVPCFLRQIALPWSKWRFWVRIIPHIMTKRVWEKICMLPINCVTTKQTNSLTAHIWLPGNSHFSCRFFPSRYDWNLGTQGFFIGCWEFWIRCCNDVHILSIVVIVIKIFFWLIFCEKLLAAIDPRSLQFTCQQSHNNVPTKFAYSVCFVKLYQLFIHTV